MHLSPAVVLLAVSLLAGAGEAIGVARTQPKKKQMKVAIAAAVSNSFRGNPGWHDAFAVFAEAGRQLAAKSAHRIDLLAIMPDNVPEEDQKAFAAIGLTPRAFPAAVNLDLVPEGFGKTSMTEGCCGVGEQMKYYGAALFEYDRVLVLDGDIMLLDSLDELFEQEGYPLMGIYDHDMDNGDSAFPPVQGGFLLFTPNKDDFNRIIEISQGGDFRGGPRVGWMGSNTGYAWGGAGPQGLLSFYYNHVRPGKPGYDPTPSVHTKECDFPDTEPTLQPPGSRFKPLHRSVVDVMDTASTLAYFKRAPKALSGIKAFHFAASCMKPWMCHPAHSQLCNKMVDHWWKLRADLETAKGVIHSPRCKVGEAYKPMESW